MWGYQLQILVYTARGGVGQKEKGLDEWMYLPVCLRIWRTTHMVNALFTWEVGGGRWEIRRHIWGLGFYVFGGTT